MGIIIMGTAKPYDFAKQNSTSASKLVWPRGLALCNPLGEAFVNIGTIRLLNRSSQPGFNFPLKVEAAFIAHRLDLMVPLLRFIGIIKMGFAQP